MARIPGIPYGPTPKAAAYASALAQPPKLVVVHCTSNTALASGEASYAATRTDDRSGWTSAHAYVDAGGPLGSLDLGLQAWAAFGWANARGWHIELCGRENAVPDAVQRVGAALVRQLCLMAGIPMEHLDGTQIRALHDGSRTRGGVTGHIDITRSGIDGNDHTDPGTTFDWSRFMGWVTSADTTGGTDMGSEWHTGDPAGPFLSQGAPGFVGQQRDTALAFAWQQAATAATAASAANGKLDQLLAAAFAEQARDAALKAVVDALAAAVSGAGGSIDTAAILAGVADAVRAAVAPLQERLAAAAHASADALDG